jgi:pimeloyl-ACP methyl ester carboxylesterase
MERHEIGGLAVDVHVAGTGPTLLYLHAEHFFKASRPFLDGLARDFRVIVPRHPGFDGRTPPADFRSVDDLAYLYLELLERMGLDDAFLVGASLGGWIATEMAVRSTARVGRLALVGPLGVKLGGPEERSFADLFAADEATVRRLLFRDPERFAPRYADLDDAEMEAIARDRQYAAWYGWSPYMHNPALGRWLHRVRVPALVLSGAHDGFAPPAHGEALARLLPQASFQAIAGAGHYPQIEQATALAEALRGFAGGRSGGTART